MNTTKIFAALCRWPARIVGTLFVALIVVIAIGEGMPNPFTLPISGQVIFLGMALVMIGNLLGWRFELTGGIIALAGFCMGFVLLFIGEETDVSGFFIVLALPGALYITSAVLRRHIETHEST
ncbi:MAG: hypothetical protein DRQ44_15020 [Gammaproteobacteria bacterium]|nr:MAG: hypothetical protein DRQ44_15020 [Gammaproteobacteria bacterium]